MSSKLIFATGNPHKVAEVRSVLGSVMEILTPEDAGLGTPDLPETSDTLEGNAREKAEALYALCHTDCFAEDTGLEVEALDGAPGTNTARYAGLTCTPEDNIAKLLSELVPHRNRRARFRAVVVLIRDGLAHCFDGSVQGTISDRPRGTGGFGYDPVFIPDGYTKTFAELPSDVKNGISHRVRAVRKMLEFLRREDQT
jgi:XTP/dITP diphosphohydrolase